MTKIILDVFSGRPNPEWELDEGQEQALKKAIDSLSTSVQLKSVHKPSGGLGYRGFIIRTEGKKGLPEKMSVFNKNVVVGGEKDIRVYEDTGGLEGWLIENARQHNYGHLIDKPREIEM